jgi:Fe2+ transport system protein FeoA
MFRSIPACLAQLTLLDEGDCGIIASFFGLDELTSQKLQALGIIPGAWISIVRRWTGSDSDIWQNVEIEIGPKRFTLDAQTSSAVFVRLVAC